MGLQARIAKAYNVWICTQADVAWGFSSLKYYISSFHYVALLWCSILDQKRPAISHALQLFPSPTTVKPHIFLFLMSYVCGKQKTKKNKKSSRGRWFDCFLHEEAQWDYQGLKKVFSQLCEVQSCEADSFPWPLSGQTNTRVVCFCLWCFCSWEHWWFLFSSLLLFLLCCVLGSLLFCFDFGFAGHQGYFPSSHVSS